MSKKRKYVTDWVAGGFMVGDSLVVSRDYPHQGEPNDWPTPGQRVRVIRDTEPEKHHGKVLVSFDVDGREGTNYIAARFLKRQGEE